MCRHTNFILAIMLPLFFVSCSGSNHSKSTNRVSDKPLKLRTYQSTSYPISDQELNRLVKYIVRACVEKGAMTPDVTVHALRLQPWTHSAELFDQDEQNDLDQLMDVMVRGLKDSDYYCSNSGKMPLLVATARGVAYRTIPHSENAISIHRNIGGLSHVDTALAAFAETGFDLKTELTLHDGKSVPARQLLMDSLARFSLKREIEWSVIAYCRYLESDIWFDRNGRQLSIEFLSDVLLKKKEGIGPCDGTHLVYAIATCAIRGKRDGKAYGDQCVNYLKGLSSHLSERQAKDGSWDANWYRSVETKGDKNSYESDKRRERFRVTAHMLEWFAIVPPELRPPDEVIGKAMSYVHTELRSRPVEYFNKMLLPTTHAIRALANLSMESQ